VEDLTVRPGLIIPATDLSWSASRASGPGGQNVNKVSSKVDLRFDLRGTNAIGNAVKARLAAAAKLDSLGRVVLVVQESRDQHRNLELARQKLAAMIRAALVIPKKRRATKPSRASKHRRLDDKKRRSDRKRTRGKVQDHD
jgi:ribosome-associated protein